MKKLAIAALVSLGLGASFSASAAGTAVPTDGSKITNADCSLLSDSVKVNLSSNVKGAYSCNDATNTIKVGTCHDAGSRTDTLTCKVIGTDDSVDPPVDSYNHASCTAADEVITGVTDYKGFFASSSGGSVGDAFLGGACTQTQLNAHWHFD